MKPVTIVLLGMLSFASAADSGEPGNPPAVFQAGEELQYSVKWKFFRLGTIVVRTELDTSAARQDGLKLTMTVESNPDLAFICIRELNESHVQAGDGFTMDFLARHLLGGRVEEARQHYDPATRSAIYSLSDSNTGCILHRDTLAGTPPFVEGASLLFKARVLSRSMGIVHLPTMIQGKIMETTLNYGGDTESIQIDACEQEVRTRKFSGTAEWTGGTAGMSGEFWGWMSDDAAAVPIRAEMKILIGSIDLELERWTRPGWTPPTRALVASAR